jgi:hypothetical protein
MRAQLPFISVGDFFHDESCGDNELSERFSSEDVTA